MALDLAELGFTTEQLQERVIDRIVDRLMRGTGCDEDGNEYGRDTEFADKLERRIVTEVDAAISRIAETRLAPDIQQAIEGMAFQETNRWGEKKGDPTSFVEYLVKRAEEFMQEPVNYSGQPKGKSDYNWTGAQTRLAYMIHQHLQYQIESAMKKIIENGNAILVGGIQQTCAMKLKEIADSLKVEVKTK